MELSASEKIKILLKRCGMTAGDLADKIGTSRQNLSNKMRRNNLSENELQEIGTALNCTVQIIFTSNETGETI